MSAATATATSNSDSRHFAFASSSFMAWFVTMIVLYACCNSSSSSSNGSSIFGGYYATAFAPIVSIQQKTTSNSYCTHADKLSKRRLDKFPNNIHERKSSSELFFFRRLLGGMNNKGDNKEDIDGDDDNDDEQSKKDNQKKVNDQNISKEERETDVTLERQDTVEDNIQNDEKISKKESSPMFFARIADWRKKDTVVVPKGQDTLTSSSTAEPSIDPDVAETVVSVDKLDESSSSKSKSDEEPGSEPKAVPVTSETQPPEPIRKEMSLQEKAEALKAQAERARLEAEKMDVLLTIEKIEKLQKELGSKAVSNDPIRVEDIKNQISSLKKKLNGNQNTSDGATTTAAAAIVNGGKSQSDKAPLDKKRDLGTVLSSVVSETREKSFNQSISMEDENLQLKVKRFQEAPLFMQKIVVKSLGMEMDSNFNVTDVVLKMYENEQGLDGATAGAYGDFSLGNGGENEIVPEFTQEQLDEVLQAVKLIPQFLKNMYGDDVKNNDTAIALMLLEEEWKSGNLVVMPEITQQMIDEKLEEIKWIPQYLRGENSTELAIELIKSDYRRNKGKQNSNGAQLSSTMQEGIQQSPQIGLEGRGGKGAEDSATATQEKKGGGFSLFGGQEQKSDKDQMVESLFPESTRKKDQEIKESQAILFMSEVLAKDNVWAASGPPEEVSGGFLIRGSTRFESGKELIDAIDKNLVNSRVRNQVNCFYVFDPTPVTEDQMNSGERPPVLFLTGPNVARDPAPIQRSLISAVTFGTIWYNALLPFLLNDKFLKLTEEQMALADASMPSNVDFLNDLSFPLFATTIGIQVIHELSHVIAARNNNLNITIPTLVPSLGTGLLGGITSLKDPPRDKQALFDFAISGPLAGIGVSTVLLIIGMLATVSMDIVSYENLPALPFNLLRQSSLAGGIINFISPGLLTVPDAALGSKALSEINIPLHPFAIAGYFGLMINAVNLLPVGRTDGGRIALTLFGRSGTQLVSFLTFVFMFIQGILGSDLLLFFFSFVVFFQSELEIPQRNEVDDMDFSRVLLATATGVLVLLTLIPM